MKALEMALEALTNPSTIAVQHAIYLLREELAKPEQEELIQFKDGKWSYVRKPWVGLTDDEIEYLRNDQPWWMVRDIEAKLREKKGG